MTEPPKPKPSLWAESLAVDIWADAQLRPWTEARQRIALRLDQIVMEAERRGQILGRAPVNASGSQKPAGGDQSESKSESVPIRLTDRPQ